MGKVIPIEPKNLQVGDTLITNNHQSMVVAIEGPDRIGTYDVFTVDKAGNRHIEIVTDIVKIEM